MTADGPAAARSHVGFIIGFPHDTHGRIIQVLPVVPGIDDRGYAWNGARDLKNVIVFVTAMVAERY